MTTFGERVALALWKDEGFFFFERIAAAVKTAGFVSKRMTQSVRTASDRSQTDCKRQVNFFWDMRTDSRIAHFRVRGHIFVFNWLIDCCPNKKSAFQYHVIISRAQVKSSLRMSLFMEMTADQVLGFQSYAQLRLFLEGGRRELVQRQNFDANQSSCHGQIWHCQYKHRSSIGVCFRPLVLQYLFERPILLRYRG